MPPTGNQMSGSNQIMTLTNRVFSRWLTIFKLYHRSIYSIPLLLLALLSTQANANKCLFVSSYHKGYAWSDGVEKGLRKSLSNICTIKQFDMDTKRNRSIGHIKKSALEARSIIENWQPDVVITADDNAARYLIKEYYRDSDIPFVFCGVNWTAKEYGFPYKNVTGIIEIAPIRPLLKQVKQLIPNASTATYIGADTVTENKNYARFEKASNKNGIQITSMLVSTMEEWIDAYRKAQTRDIIILGSNAGIRHWDAEKVKSSISKTGKTITITNHEWMMPFTMLGFTKVAEEQGAMAAMMAISILNGTDITDIAMIPNRKWDVWTNRSLLKAANITLPRALVNKSKQIN